MQLIVDRIIWGWPFVFILILTSIYFCVRTRFVQLRFLKIMPKLLFQKNDDKNKISSFQSIALVLANHVGTGNIVGVSLAIMYGGPGAVFWMWVSAFLCSALSFVENTLGQMYKIEVNGEYRGGPAYYISKGLNSKFWALIVATVFFICIGVFMPTIQSATIASTLNYSFLIPKYIIGLIVTITIGLIIIGNSKKIVHVAEVVVPFMAVFYLLVAIIIVLIHFNRLDNVILLILNNAFNKDAIYGSILGSAIAYGLRRGLFSNEAGVGSSPNISASANVSHPVIQGLISTFCVFIDTILICSATAFMILVTNCYNIMDKGKYLFKGLPNDNREQFVQEAINSVFNNYGTLFVAIALFFFAYTSLFSSFFNAQTNLIYLFKNERYYKWVNKIYKLIFLGIIYVSSIFETSLAWAFADLGLGIAALVNIIVMVLLGKKVLEALSDFELKYKSKDNSRYVNKDLDCWN